MEIALIALAVLVVGYLVWDKMKSPDASPAKEETTTPHTPEPPQVPEPPVGRPDPKGRIRIPEVEALGGDWERTRWFAPWALDKVNDPVARWNIRGNVGCDDDGKLGPAPGRGFESAGFGSPLTVYSWLVPYEYDLGTDKYGRKNIVYRTEEHVTDKLTRSTRAKDGKELAKYLKDNPQIKPIPETGDWDGGVG